MPTPPSPRLVRWLPKSVSHPKSVVPRLLTLEDRVNPITTLFFDFGIGVGVGNSLNTTAATFRDIFGPGLAGGGGQYGTGSDMTGFLGAGGSLEFRPLNYDYDGVGGVTNADLTALANDVIAIARRAVAPYDMDVQLANATSYANAVTTVAANAGDPTGEFDAYNFIGSFTSDAFGGGSVGDNIIEDNSGLFGIAAADDLYAATTNNQDEATLIFSDTIFGATNGTPGTAAFNRNLVHRLAYTIVHEAAHTLALYHTAGSGASGYSAAEQLLTSGDQIRLGSVTRETTNIFTRFALGRQEVGGLNNNYESFRTDPDIGLRDDNRNTIPDFAYVTGTGGHDRITITRTSATTADVLVQAYSNPTRTTVVRSLNYSVNLTTDTEGGFLVDGSAGDDEIIVDGDVAAGFTVRGNDGNDRIVLRGQATTAITGLTALGEDGDDTLVVDFTNGNPLPAGASFDGGRQTLPDGDVVRVGGGSFATVTHNMTDASSGSLVFSAAGTLGYTGLEPVDMTGTTIADLVFNLPAAASTALLEDDGTGGNGVSRLRSGNATFETTIFANPTGGVTINRGNAADTLVVDALPDFTTGLTVGTALNPFANVGFWGAITFAADRSLSAFSSGDILLTLTASDLTLSGTGSVSFTAARNIGVAAGASVTTAAGGITFSANQQAVATAGQFTGISVSGTVSAGAGNVSLTGRGGDTGNLNVGVSVFSGGIVQTTGSGTVGIIGQGGAGGGDDNHGVHVDGVGSLVTSSGGGVTVQGTGGGSGASGSNHGVLIDNNGAVTGTGTATAGVTGIGGAGGGSNNSGVRVVNGGSVSSVDGLLSVQGTGGGSGAGGDNYGVYLGNGLITATGSGGVTVTGLGGATTGDLNVGVWVNTSTISSLDGNVNVQGTGGGSGASGYNYGVFLLINGQVRADGAGTVTVSGTGGAANGTNNHGLYINGGSAGVLSSGGAVSVTGTGGGGTGSFGINMSGGNFASGGTGTLTLTADSMDLASASLIRGGATGTGTVTLRPLTTGTLIDLGGADVLTGSPLTLGLTDAELDRVTAGTLILGRSTAGNITLSADLSRPASTNVQLISGADITSTAAAGRFDTGGGTLSVTTGTAAGQGFTASRTGTDVIASNLTFSAGTDLEVAITGPAANTGYPQLNTSDAIDLTGLDLTLSGAYVPVAGDEFVLVSAGTLTGTFAGLANGAVVTFNGVNLHIFYTSTTATLRANRAPTGVSPGGPYAIAEGAGLVVTAPAATDPDGDTLTYTWDVNGDGTFGDEADGTVSNGGRTVTYTPAQLLLLGLGDGAFSTAALAVRVSDGLTFGTVTATGGLAVTNVAPSVAVSGTGTANEGAVYTLTLGAVTDPGQDAVTQYRVNWGDGTSDTYATAGAKTHTYADDGAYTVTVDVTDEDGTFANVGTAHSVAVSNVAPVVTAPATVPSPNEGATTTFDLGSFTDPAGANDGPYSVVVNWGDGNSDTFTVAAPGSLGSLAHAYADNSTYTVTVSVSEVGGAPTANAAFNVTVNNVAPTPAISGPTGGVEGTALAFTATATDPAGTNDPIAFTWSVTKNGAAFATGTGPAFTFTPDDDGTYVLSLTADDGDGGVTTVTRTLPVTNVAPTVTAFNVPTAGSETTAVSVAAAATDPAGVNDPLAFAWAVLKNGMAYTTGTGTGFTFTPDDNGAYTVTLTVTDGDGGSVTRSGTVNVTNVPPAFTSVNVPTSGVGGSPIAMSATALDIAGPQDPLTYTWAISRNGVPYTTGTGTSFTFTPAVGGEFTVTVTANDGDGGQAVATRTVSVTPPPQQVTAVGNSVKVRDPRDNSVKTFVPFLGFTGAVTTASGDLNGDGVFDVAAGAGAGGGPHVKVYDGATGMELASFFAFDTGFTGGVSVAAAGGRLVVGAGAGGSPHVKVIDVARIGERRADGVIAESALTANFFAFDGAFTGGVSVAAADVTGDGVPDVVVGAGPGGSPHVKGIDGTKLAQVRPDGVIADSALFANFFAFDPGFAGGVNVAATGGRIAVAAGAGAGPHVKVIDLPNLGQVQPNGVIADSALTANFFAFDPSFTGGVRVAFADVNLDGVPDLLTAAGPGGTPHLKAFNIAPLVELESVLVGDANDPRGVSV